MEVTPASPSLSGNSTKDKPLVATLTANPHSTLFSQMCLYCTSKHKNGQMRMAIQFKEGGLLCMKILSRPFMTEIK